MPLRPINTIAPILTTRTELYNHICTLACSHNRQRCCNVSTSDPARFYRS